MSTNNTTAAFVSAFTLQSLQHKIAQYKSDAEQFGTTVSEQSEQYPLEVTVYEVDADSLERYENDHTLGFTQKMVSRGCSQDEVTADVCDEIRSFFDLDEDFCIEVAFEQQED